MRELQRRKFLGYLIAGGVGASLSVGIVTAATANDPATEAYALSVRRLYLAYFLREPEPEGWEFWVDSGWDLHRMSQYFAEGEEFQTKYGELNDAEFVTLVYRNVLGREAEADGFDFWVSVLGDGSFTRGRLMIGFSEGEEFANANPPGPATPPIPGATTTVPDPGVSTPS